MKKAVLFLTIAVLAALVVIVIRNKALVRGEVIVEAEADGEQIVIES